MSLLDPGALLADTVTMGFPALATCVLVIVHGQLVTVMAVAEVTVYVWPFWIKLVAPGQYIVYAVTTSMTVVTNAALENEGSAVLAIAVALSGETGLVVVDKATLDTVVALGTTLVLGTEESLVLVDVSSSHSSSVLVGT